MYLKCMEIEISLEHSFASCVICRYFTCTFYTVVGYVKTTMSDFKSKGMLEKHPF